MKLATISLLSIFALLALTISDSASAQYSSARSRLRSGRNNTSYGARSSVYRGTTGSSTYRTGSRGDGSLGGRELIVARIKQQQEEEQRAYEEALRAREEQLNQAEQQAALSAKSGKERITAISPEDLREQKRIRRMEKLAAARERRLQRQAERQAGVSTVRSTKTPRRGKRGKAVESTN